jgi:hypothetical protein
VRDVAYSVTRASRWDVVRTNVGDRAGRPVYARAEAIYRPAHRRWEQAARYTRHAIAFHSRHTGVAYPYPHATAVEGDGIIGGGMAPRGCADASLYRRFHALGLTDLKCFPQLVSVVPGQPRLERYQQQILAALSPAEAETWRRAVAQAETEGTFFIAQVYHCAVGTKAG